ncbi:MAG: helix-turn-helix transcriptional regulator, partial [Sphaerochaetaceae bacterium]|nr:helix-turn-helix transcriptional regulator [Sphaerochaetaceae bacterium]
SENYIRRFFKKKMGITLGSYIIELRISKSLFYLFKKEYLISEIAELCGYETIYSYSRAFKQIMKCSPKQFRLKVNTKPELLNEYRANQEMRIAIKMNNK